MKSPAKRLKNLSFDEDTTSQEAFDRADAAVQKCKSADHVGKSQVCRRSWNPKT